MLAVHEPLDIEFSILKQRLARRLVAEGQTDDSVGKLDLVELTKVRGGMVGITRNVVVSDRSQGSLWASWTW